MNEIPESTGPKSESVVSLVASLLVLVGAIALASAVLNLVGAFVLPVGAFAAISFVTWWAVWKVRGSDAPPSPDEIKAAARTVLRESARITGKALRATAVAAKAIHKESKH